MGHDRRFGAQAAVCGRFRTEVAILRVNNSDEVGVIYHSRVRLRVVNTADCPSKTDVPLTERAKNLHE
jgi:hypothetical protein